MRCLRANNQRRGTAGLWELRELMLRSVMWFCIGFGAGVAAVVVVLMLPIAHRDAGHKEWL